MSQDYVEKPASAKSKSVISSKSPRPSRYNERRLLKDQSPLPLGEGAFERHVHSTLIMADSFFRQFLFHLKWSLWVLLVTAAAAAGIWWLLARQNWFAVKPLPWLNLNTVILLIATAVFIPLTMLLRSHETRDLLQKCLLFSILVHVAITMLLSGISVSRDVIHYVNVQTSLEVPINLEASRAAELQLAVRNQITNLPVTTPNAGRDEARQSSIEISIEPPRPIQTEVPR